jgi:DNA-binding winged helix-turn-helix (wHTH) protein/tetratricopeptide (TPR) repeat protein
MLVLSDRTVDLARGTVNAPEGELKLTTKETQLLSYLVDRASQVVSREELLAQVWGYQPQALTRAVDNMMKKLRSKVEADPAEPQHLVTVFGEGYRFDPAFRPRPQASARSQLLAPRLIVGREELVQQARAWLAQGRRCLVFVGPAGMGKSTVARQVAVEEGPSRPGGAWWCSPGAADMAGLRQSVCSALGSTEEGLLRALEASGRLLLVLDGIDAMSVEACAEIEAWLSLAPGLDVVATSRRVRLGAIATVVEVPPLEPGPARQILESHAARVRPGRPLREEEVSLLLEPLQGWPLAIELAASRLRALSPQEVAQRLGSLEFLRDPSEGGSLQSALRASIEALDPHTRRVFADCSVFSGGFSPSDAEAICGGEGPRADGREAGGRWAGGPRADGREAGGRWAGGPRADGREAGGRWAGEDLVDALHRLVDHSLLRSQPDGRLIFLDAIAQAARGLQEPARAEELRQRHLEHFVEVASACRVPPVERHWARVRSEWANLLEAHRLALASSPESAARLALVLQRELALRGQQQHRQQILRLTLACRPSPAHQLALELELLNARAALGEDVAGDYPLLVAEADRLGDPELRVTALLSHAQSTRRKGKLLEAEALCRKAIDMATSQGSLYVRAWGPLALAGVLMDQGRAEEAILSFQQAGHLAREAGDRQLEGQVLWGLGLLEVVRGRPSAAEIHLHEALARCPEEPRVRLDAHLILAQVAAGKGEMDRARELCDQIRPELLRHGDGEREGILCAISAELHIARRDWDAAEAAIRRQIVLCASIPHQGIYAAGNLGLLLRVAGKTEQALDQLLRTREQAAHMGANRLVSDLTPDIAAARADLDDPSGAQAELAKLSEETPSVLLARAHLCLAQARAGDADALERARALRAQLAGTPAVMATLRMSMRRLTEVFMATETETETE